MIIKTKLLFLVIVCLIYNNNIIGQGFNKIDSLKSRLKYSDDTTEVWRLHDLSFAYIYTNPDSAFKYGQDELKLAVRINYQRGIIRGLNDIGNFFWNTGNYLQALDNYLKALVASEKIHDTKMQALCYSNIGIVYLDLEDYAEAIEYIRKALEYDSDSSRNNRFSMMIENMNLGEVYQKLNRDSSIKYQTIAYQLSLQLNDEKYIGRILKNFGNLYLEQDYSFAESYFIQSLKYLKKTSDYRGLSQAYCGFAILCKKRNNPDSMVLCASRSLEAAMLGKYSLGIIKSMEFLSKGYAEKNKDSSLKYYKLLNDTRDSIFSIQKTRTLENISVNERLRQEQLKILDRQSKDERKLYIQFFVIILIILFLIIILLILIKRKRKSKRNKYFGIITLLIFFEFINLLLHPFLEKITNHTPPIMLGIMVVIAAALGWVHDKIEAWVAKKIAKRQYKKNKPNGKRIPKQIYG